MSDGVLPGWEPVLVVGEPVPYELTYAVQGEPLVRSLHYRHRDQSDVGVGRLHRGAPLRLDALGLSGLVIHLLILVLLFLVVTLVLSLIEGLLLALDVTVRVALLEVVGLQLLPLEPQTLVETVRDLVSTSQLLAHHCLHRHCTQSIRLPPATDESYYKQEQRLQSRPLCV